MNLGGLYYFYFQIVAGIKFTKMKYKKRKNRFLWHMLSLPFIYCMIIPLIVLDIFIELFHRVCFAIYLIPYVKRSKYIRIDRHKLKYLNITEKLNCMFCGYANGLLQYSVIIAGETEKYWCGIKHKNDSDFNQPSHHNNFLEFNDEEAYRKL